jgi:hypothetical protein
LQPRDTEGDGQLPGGGQLDRPDQPVRRACSTGSPCGARRAR